ncbi:glycosyltransferase family 39 protein [Kovacikia minuta CCNUW1]|uniref:ArnT family glycosyltransferase n=1 Tax=Kovacikia minuta TaxID=2931930 RepID=UPI001CCC3711|nr:glycosyltransferase family 39 protein [Kovacikia minuta]UBF23733.1 glycosyltransferase family 39 protein [Kovacikia minuta CCNUW1]
MFQTYHLLPATCHLPAASLMPPRSLLPFLIAFLLLRLVFWFTTFPNPDEAYYWLWGQHPGLSYYDHPPFPAWIQGFTTAVFGRSRFVLRLPNLVSNGIFFYIYYRITTYLYGTTARHYFWLTVLLILASPLYFLFLALAWNDHWLITFSLISCYWFIQFLDGYLRDGKGESWRLYGAAGAIGLAFLCKYNAVFIILGFAAAIVANKGLHPLGRDRRIYWAGAIAASALIPILLWNLSNDFQSFHYYVDRSVNTRGFNLNIGPCLNFLLFSFLLVSPFNWIGFYRSFKQRDRWMSSSPTYRSVAFWVFLSSTVPLTMISLLSAALYYWNITAYLLLFPLVPAVFLKAEGRGQRAEGEEGGHGDTTGTRGHGGKDSQHSALSTQHSALIQNSKFKIQNSPTPHTPHPTPLLWNGQFYGLLFATLLIIHYSILPISALFSKTEDPDSRMLFGWEKVAAVVSAESTELEQFSFPHPTPHTPHPTPPLLITTDYRSASALAFQRNDPTVIAISDRVDQFDFWYPSEQSFKNRNAVILFDDWHPIQPKLLSQFKQTSAPVTIPITRFGVWIKNYYVLRGYQFK